MRVLSLAPLLLAVPMAAQAQGDGVARGLAMRASGKADAARAAADSARAALDALAPATLARKSDIDAAIATALTGMPSTTTVNTAIANAVAPLATAAAVASVAASVPPPCAAKPASDTTAGTAGTGTLCTARQDAARATQVMPATATTLADGTFSGSWPGTFAPAPTTAFADAKTTADPYTCQVAVVTTTTFAGKCWKIVTMTLPSVAANLLGLVLSPYVNSPAGITVMVVGRQ